MTLRSLLLLPLLLLAGCASRPAFEVVPADAAPPVHRVADAPERFIDAPVLWGGMIIEVRNFENHSEIEVLSYPLDERQAPRLEAPDEGRFIVLLPGYVEAHAWPAGRFLSLVGRITGERRGTLGPSGYVWPEVDVDQLHLWPRDFREPKTRFSVGVGVRL